MLKTYFECERTCTRYYQSAAGPHLDTFVQWLADRGYQHQTVRRRIHGAAYFVDWAQAKGWTVSRLNTEALNRFGRFLARHDRLRDSSGAYQVCFLGARHFLRFLQAHEITTACETEPMLDAPVLFQEFRFWCAFRRS